MGMVVQHNMNALNAYNKLNANVAGFKKSSEKLASGYRINRAGDDAAGLAISEKMRGQIKGLNQAIRNSQDGINMIQTYEGAAQESHSILQRMKELAAEAANGTYQNEVDRDAIQLEFNQLNDELDQIADTDFNGTVMLNGGVMADGTTAADGKFDYVNSTRAALQIGTASDMLIGLGVDGNTTTSANAGTVTFTASKYDDGTVVWQANKGAKGTVGAGAVDADTAPTQTSAITGGFTYNGVTVNIDTTKVESGDTIVVRFDAPEEAEGKTSKVTGNTTDWGIITGSGTAVLGSDITAAGISAITITDTGITNQAIADALNYLNTATFETTFAGKQITKVTMNGVDLNVDPDDAPANIKNDKDIDLISYQDGSKIYVKKGEKNVYFLDKDGNDIKLAELKLGKNTDGVSTAGVAKTTAYTSVASYKPAGDKGAKVLEPKGVVSRSNSNNKATAPLTYTDQLVLQTGARTKDSVNFTFSYDTDGMGELKANLDISSRANGLNTKNLSLATQEDANAAIDQIDNAINKVSMVRATFGATQNRLEHKITNLTTTSENLTEAESSIRDTDMASEMMNYTKFNILQQAAQSMLAQANQQPQSILQLLG